jgi:hypothetical protein
MLTRSTSCTHKGLSPQQRNPYITILNSRIMQIGEAI